jgi:hypothetical protein
VYDNDPVDHTKAAVLTQLPPATFPYSARRQMVTRQAINVLTLREKCTPNCIFTPRTLETSVNHINLKHYASPMVHPVTGKIISARSHHLRGMENVFW